MWDPRQGCTEKGRGGWVPTATSDSRLWMTGVIMGTKRTKTTGISTALAKAIKINLLRTVSCKAQERYLRTSPMKFLPPRPLQYRIDPNRT